MRLMPSRYIRQDPVLVKKKRADVKHLVAPIKGLSLSSKQVQGDPLTATILDNWVIEEGQVKTRAGTGIIWTYSDTSKPVWHLIPFYGTPNKYCIAIDGKLIMTDNFVLRSGFPYKDWHWTAFTNLSATDYTVMVNGSDGVWSWEGNYTTAPVVVTSLTNTNPARCVVAAADIGKFTNGMTVRIAGATGIGMSNANGVKTISLVGTPANNFTLNATDCSAGAAPQTVGVTADPPGGLVKENVTAPPASTWVNPNHFAIVLSHMNRLWFADESNQSVFYLPIQTKSGEVKELPLQSLFKRGGHIRAMGTWTRDGGGGMDDCLVIFSTNGEAVVYSGTDPNTAGAWELVGIFRFDAPMSKHAVANYGGDLFCLISTGLVPMSTLIQSETEQLGQSDRNIFSIFFNTTFSYRDRPGWRVTHNPSSGRMICNLPFGAPNKYRQAVRFMPNPIWATWSSLPSRCWMWLENRMYFGSDDGKVYEISPLFLNDTDSTGKPKPIRVDLQMSWHNYNSAGIKHFKMVLPYITSNGNPAPFVDMKVNYSMTLPRNQPDQTTTLAPGASWNTATWNVDSWAGGLNLYSNWQGVAAMGRVGAPRLMADILNCSFAVSGFDVIYDGSVFDEDEDVFRAP
jgi:hypothetical protein